MTDIEFIEYCHFLSNAIESVEVVIKKPAHHQVGSMLVKFEFEGERSELFRKVIEDSGALNFNGTIEGE